MTERESAAGALAEAVRRLALAMERCESADAEFAALWQALACYDAAPADGWRPIETAPKDGSTILLGDIGGVEPGFWHDGSQLPPPPCQDEPR